MKKKTKFTIGDRVRSLCEVGDCGETGSLGTVVRVELIADGRVWSIGVDYDEDIDGHNCDGKAKGGHGWNMDTDQIEIVKAASEKKKEIVFDLTKLDSLVLEQGAKTEIAAVLKQHKHSDTLFKTWGLGETIEYGKGMSFMFHGPPGTGKTWAAHCIAKAIGMELLVMGVADIQSSEPGAANRNIQQAFRTAREKEMVLFIDECDSLIWNRADLGMVLSSEVNTLLTEIEKSEGIVILATNRIDTMDEALERRISLIVEFPLPSYENRKEIWKKLLPEKLPLGSSVKLEELATPEMSGGQIKNVILQAARLALGAESKEVTIHHFAAAIERMKKSKNLMGTASRYRQGGVQDYSVGKRPTSDITRFLDTQ